MEHEVVGDDGSLDPLSLKQILPENSVEYMIFVAENSPDGTTNSKPLAKLEAVRKAALQLSENLTENYIWQRESFNLELISQKSFLYLHGITDYGDCVEDEWLIVYMLCEISKSFPDVWVRVSDSDGEFLLVEAACVVPRWLNPEMDANRVWIHRGQLRLIPPADTTVTGVSLSLTDAVRLIKSDPERLFHIPALEAEAFDRLKKYPKQIKDAIHFSRVLIPRKIAFILHDRPQAIAPAIEVFYMRDSAAMARISSLEPTKLLFPPIDLVFVSVKFTRVLFAQLRGLRFTPPEIWSKEFAAYVKDAAEAKGEEGARSARVMANLGMKITCGFELMAMTAGTNNSRVVREIGIVLEDLAEDGDGVSALPTDEEIRSWRDFDREDDESWLDINFEEFERELDGQKRAAGNAGPSKEGDAASGFGDHQVQTDLRKIVSRFQDFLNDSGAGLDGVDMDEMDMDNDEEDEDDEDEDEDDESDASFNEETFSRLLREMMGLPPTAEDLQQVSTTTPQSTALLSVDSQRASGSIQRNSGAGMGDADESEDSNDDAGILSLATQFEAELKGHDALRINPPARGGADNASEDEGEVDVDYNLAKNLLESFKSQAGMAGPAGNILGMMGLSLPRDDDQEEGNEEENEKETSK